MVPNFLLSVLSILSENVSVNKYPLFDKYGIQYGANMLKVFKNGPN